MNGWFERRSTWQFALIWVIVMFLASFLGGAAFQEVWKGHIDVIHLVSAGLVAAVLTGIPATYVQRLRQPAPDDNQSREPGPRQ